MANRAYTLETLNSKLRDMATREGHIPSRMEVEKDPTMPSVQTYFRYHNTANWNIVLQNSGLQPKRIVKTHTDKELREWFDKKHTELGRSPTASEVDRDPRMASASTYMRHFGVTSWNKVALTLGKTPKKTGTGRKTKYTPESLSQGLKDMRTRLGRLPTLSEVVLDPTMPAAHTYQIYFSTKWLEVLELTGLYDPETDPLEFKVQLLFKTMTLGRFPTSKEAMEDPEMEHPQIYMLAFNMTWKELKRSLESGQ